NDDAIGEFLGIRDNILRNDHKKGFSIQLNACAYFGEEVELCGNLSKKLIMGKISKENPCGNKKRKSYSENLFEALMEKLKKKPMEKIMYPLQDEEIPEPPMIEEDLNLPPYPTRMGDESKLLVEDTKYVNIGMEELPQI
ncbi:hypothetical protein KI387_029475, partial [Taxus chinensis]